ncbi:hypothetical protein ACFOQM_11100 [Paenibacillus sp. GCM10012307]|uniref:Uncharacterized protein n=1 Tax=Paenibacillus roseus TaxID=2798579 RepID=A0A934J533_9BACL|nr:hypothetical protein [Paenibacillus roseus]MBJ6361834.1 hypothetical protein [Paenibacillus roseus]
MQHETNEINVTTSESTPLTIQLENPMKAFKKLYLILILLGAIAFAAMGGAVGSLFGVVIGWAAAYLSMQFIAGIKLFKLNYKDHLLPNPITDEQLYQNLSTSFSHPDIKVEKGAFGVRFVYKSTTAHRIKIDHKNKTYSIVSKLTVKKRIFNRHNPGVTEYTTTYAVTPILLKAVEEASKAVSESGDA